MVAGEARQLQGRLTPADRGRMDDYLQNVREIELRLERTEKQNAASVGTPGSPVGVPDDYAEHVGLMFDLMAVAFQADITRVFTFMLGRELSSRTYPQLGISEPHHAVSHHQNKPERIEKYATTNAYHAQLVGEVPGEAEGDSRRRRHAARSLAAALGLGHEQPEHPQLRSAAGGAARRRLRPPEGRPAHRDRQRGHADGESAAVAGAAAAAWSASGSATAPAAVAL